MTNKRELVPKAFKGRKGGAKSQLVLVPFWRRWVAQWFSKSRHFRQNVWGTSTSSEVQPDFVKIMSDGFFSYTPIPLITDQGAFHQRIWQLLSPRWRAPWFDQQVALVKEVATLPKLTLWLFILFCSLTHLKWQISNKVAFRWWAGCRFSKRRPQTFQHVPKVIVTNDPGKKIITEAKVGWFITPRPFRCLV